MKLLTLRLCNLAAFAGEHTLDFTCSPLAECGLFAITGPTGSGKSTLLDAMCLALFGSTPRLRQMPGAGTLPQDDSVQLRDPRTLLRRGCAQAFAEVTFIGIDNQRYSARWSVRRARNSPAGKLQASTQVLCLIDPEERVLTDGKQDFNRQLPEVLGLSFDQFTRAVLLAQAEFSAFLKANDNERSALLERLTDSDIYSRISRRAYQHYHAIKQHYTDLATHLEHARPCDDSERATLDREVHHAHEALTLKQHALSTHRDQQRHVTHQRTLVSHYMTHRQRFTELDQQWHSHSDKRTLHEALNRFAAVRNAFSEQQSHQQQHAALEAAQQRHHEAVTAAAQAATDSEQQWLQARRQRQALETQQQHDVPRLEKALALEQQLHQLRSRLQDLSAAQTDLRTQQQTYEHQCLQLDQAHKEDRATLTHLNQQRCSLTSLPASQRLASLRYRSAQLERLHQRWTQRYEAAQRTESLQQQLTQQRSEQQHAERLHHDYSERARHTEGALADASAHHQQLHDALQAYSEHTLAALRRLMKNDAPCPICGSCTPTACPTDPSAIVEAQQKAAQQLHPAQQSLNQARQQHDTAQQQQQRADIALAAARARCEQIEHTLAEQPVQEASHTRLYCQTRLATLLQRLDQLQQQVDALSTCLTRRHAIEERLATAEQQRQHIAGAMQQNHEQRQRLQQQLDTLKQQLLEQQADLAAQLGDQPSAHEWKRSQGNALQALRQREQTRQDHHEQQRLALEQARLAQHNDHALWVTHCARLETLTTLLDEWRAAQPAEWQTTSALSRLSAITPTEHAALAQSLSALENNRREADIRQRTYRQQCEDLLDEQQRVQLDTPAPLLSTLDEQLATLAAQQEQLLQHVEHCQHAYDSARARQIEDDQRRQRYSELTRQRQDAEQALERWGKISGLIGSADGALFRKMAQQWHLDVLIVHANHHLATLARRFSLKRGGTELGIMIVDSDMGDEERSVHSLSGGETFLVSLALALGLAAMASDRLLIGTLFIDEGFGSLDTRARAVAMDALEALQAQGRQVGIISHVQELHERIPVQVQVCPGGRNGASYLNITSPRTLLDIS